MRIPPTDRSVHLKGERAPAASLGARSVPGSAENLWCLRRRANALMKGTEPKPSELPVIRPYIKEVREMIAVICPAQSKGAGRRGEVGTEVRSMRTVMQTGILITKTSRQFKVASIPPRRGPAAPARVPPTAQSPRAFVRRRGSGKALRIKDSDAGRMTEAAAPWTARPAMRTPVVGARAQAIDPRRKTNKPHPSALFAHPIR